MQWFPAMVETRNHSCDIESVLLFGKISLQRKPTRKRLAAIYRQEIIQDVTLFTSQRATNFYDKLFMHWPPFYTVLTPTVLPNSFGVPPDLLFHTFFRHEVYRAMVFAPLRCPKLFWFPFACLWAVPSARFALLFLFSSVFIHIIYNFIYLSSVQIWWVFGFCSGKIFLWIFWGSNSVFWKKG